MTVSAHHLSFSQDLQMLEQPWSISGWNICLSTSGSSFLWASREFKASWVDRVPIGHCAIFLDWWDTLQIEIEISSQGVRVGQISVIVNLICTPSQHNVGRDFRDRSSDFQVVMSLVGSSRMSSWSQQRPFVGAQVIFLYRWCRILFGPWCPR